MVRGPGNFELQHAALLRNLAVVVEGSGGSLLIALLADDGSSLRRVVRVLGQVDRLVGGALRQGGQGDRAVVRRVLQTQRIAQVGLNGEGAVREGPVVGVAVARLDDGRNLRVLGKVYGVGVFRGVAVAGDVEVQRVDRLFREVEYLAGRYGAGNAHLVGDDVDGHVAGLDLGRVHHQPGLPAAVLLQTGGAEAAVFPSRNIALIGCLRVLEVEESAQALVDGLVGSRVETDGYLTDLLACEDTGVVCELQPQGSHQALELGDDCALIGCCDIPDRLADDVVEAGVERCGFRHLNRADAVIAGRSCGVLFRRDEIGHHEEIVVGLGAGYLRMRECVRTVAGGGAVHCAEEFVVERLRCRRGESLHRAHSSNEPRPRLRR